MSVSEKNKKLKDILHSFDNDMQQYNDSLRFDTKNIADTDENVYMKISSKAKI